MLPDSAPEHTPPEAARLRRVVIDEGPVGTWSDEIQKRQRNTTSKITLTTADGEVIPVLPEDGTKETPPLPERIKNQEPFARTERDPQRPPRRHRPHRRQNKEEAERGLDNSIRSGIFVEGRDPKGRPQFECVVELPNGKRIKEVMVKKFSGKLLSKSSAGEDGRYETTGPVRYVRERILASKGNMTTYLVVPEQSSSRTR